MAGAAVLGTRKCSGLQKTFTLHFGVPRNKRLVFAVVIIVIRRDRRVIGFAFCLVLFIGPRFHSRQSFALGWRIFSRWCLRWTRGIGRRRGLRRIARRRQILRGP